jgi:hypothetical protein
MQFSFDFYWLRIGIDALATEDKNELVIKMAHRVLLSPVGEGGHCLRLPKVILYVVNLAVL